MDEDTAAVTKTPFFLPKLLLLLLRKINTAKTIRQPLENALKFVLTPIAVATS